ncbi:MAG: DEAD/DEAH box helicase family protein [Treponema sp.]|jgi:superfamily II DNA or RNA helicase|nr:DEAD/DEAH box helicase family protein [Treponema sp.]
MELRKYQADVIGVIRDAFQCGALRVCLCVPTGGGKTAIAAEIMKSIYSNGKRVWFCVPRLELIVQARETLAAFGVPHGEISASLKEGWCRVCVVSRDTVVRRLNRYPPPDVIFFDEAHVALEQQRKIAFYFPEAMVIGMTATPERGDGMPLKFTKTARSSAGLYDALIQAESIPNLQSQGVLSGLDYYGLSLEGVESVDPGNRPEAGEELDKIIIYGDIADYYERLGKGRLAIGFAPTIHIAEKCVDILNGRGHRFRLIHGGMPLRERSLLIRGLKSGSVDGLVNAALLTYGFDAPEVSYAFSVRYIRSRPLWIQMVGRVIRGHPGKDRAVFVDHTGTVYNFPDDGRGGRYGHNGYNHIFEDPIIKWDFEGRKIVRCLYSNEHACINKSKRKTPRCLFDAGMLCGAPLYYFSDTCLSRSSPDCPKEIVRRGYTAKDGIDVTEGELVNLSKKQVYREAEGIAVRWDDFTVPEKIANIKKLNDMSVRLNYSPLWVYWKINEGRSVVDTFTLKQLAELRGYRNGWIWHKEQEIRERIKDAQELSS